MRSILAMTAVTCSILFAGAEASAQWRVSGGRGRVVYSVGTGSVGYSGYGNSYSTVGSYFPSYSTSGSHFPSYSTAGYTSVYSNDVFGLNQSNYQTPYHNSSFGQTYYQTPVYHQSYYQTQYSHSSPTYYPMSHSTVAPVTYYRRGR
jgi:hypothetical protein